MAIESKAENYKIISSFIKYTRLGLSSESLSPFDAYKRICGCCRNYSEACDLLAVYDTMRLLRLSKKYDVINAVRGVYFCSYDRMPQRNEISRRVLNHAIKTNCDERTVYRQLGYARGLYRMLRDDCQ